MDRLATCGLMLLVVVGSFFPMFADQKPSKDQAPIPWEGEYLKFGEYDTMREGQFGKAQRIRIAKREDGYYLSKPYDGRRFTESKGVLSDGAGGLGEITFGTVTYANGMQARILRVKFCYEQFILYSESKLPAIGQDSKDQR